MGSATSLLLHRMSAGKLLLYNIAINVRFEEAVKITEFFESMITIEKSKALSLSFSFSPAQSVCPQAHCGTWNTLCSDVP